MGLGGASYFSGMQLSVLIPGLRWTFFWVLFWFSSLGMLVSGDGEGRQPLLLLDFLCTGVRAQTMDDFLDGNFRNPDWTGDTLNFTQENGRLELRAPAAGESNLAVDLRVLPNVDTLEYQLLVEMDFAPSASNFCSVFLGNDGGGFLELRMGGVSGSGDRIVGTYFDGMAMQEVLLGAEGALGAAPAVVRWRLRRLLDAAQSSPGNPVYVWELATDYAGGTDFMVESTSSLMGNEVFDELSLSLTYSATRTDRFAFDDLLVSFGGVQMDETAPTITNAEVLDADLIRLTASEPVEATPTAVGNYQLSPAGIATVSNVSVVGNVIDVELADDLLVGQDFTLTVLSLEDTAGNVTENTVLRLRYAPVVGPAAGRFLVSEIMADPSPVVGLPEVEYVELRNLTDSTLALAGVGIASGGSPVILPAGTEIAPGGYLVITDTDFVGSFATDVNVVGVNLPGLSNAGDVITLSRGNDVLFELTYSDDWYNDRNRDDGGYSLEFTGGADATCGGLWRASLDASGGTPGRVNSVVGNPVDESGPRLIGSSVDEDGVTLEFDEATEPSFTVLSGPDLTGVVASPEGTSFRLSFAEELSPGVEYRIEISGTVDCAGNETGSSTIVLGIPGVPEPGDVLINEVLFNPASGGSDFVELYNASDQFFQVEGWTLRNSASTSNSASRTVTANRLFQPGEYLVFTGDPENIITSFQSVTPELVVEQTLPSLPDNEGNITVQVGATVLDAFDYSEDYHSGLLRDENGVSLERILLGGDTQNPNL